MPGLMKDDVDNVDLLRHAGIRFIKKNRSDYIQVDEEQAYKYLKDYNLQVKELQRYRIMSSDPNKMPEPTKDVGLQQFVKFVNQKIFAVIKKDEYAEYLDDEGVFEMKYSGKFGTGFMLFYRYNLSLRYLFKFVFYYIIIISRSNSSLVY